MTSQPAPSPDAPPRLVTVGTTGSTNTDLRRALTAADGHLDVAAARAWPHLSALRAVAQSAGRGRGDHVWTTPPTGALLVSFVLRPLVPLAHLGWLPLVAGLAVRDVVAARARIWQVGTKWPNDVVVAPRDGSLPDVPGWGGLRKVGGLLTEVVLPSPRLEGAATQRRAPARRDTACAVVVGVGLNVCQDDAGLPVPWAASLRTMGLEATVDGLLTDVTRALGQVTGTWEAAGGDLTAPTAGGQQLGARLRQTCTTLGRRVRVQAPGGEVVGTAVDLRPGLVVTDVSGQEHVLSAGDVSHVRYPVA